MASSSSSSRSKKALRRSSSSSRSGTRVRSKTTVMGFTYENFGILAVDARLSEDEYNRVADNGDYEKFVKVYDNEHIYLGFSGAKDCMGRLKQHLPKWCRQRPKPLNLEAAVSDVLLFVNQDFANRWRDARIDVDILALGAIGNEPFGMFLITKEMDAGVYVSERVADHKICIGRSSQVVGGLMKSCRNGLDMEQAAYFAFEGVKYAIERDWFSGGAIHLIKIHRGFSEEHQYRQDNPKQCSDEYLEVSYKRR